MHDFRSIPSLLYCFHFFGQPFFVFSLQLSFGVKRRTCLKINATVGGGLCVVFNPFWARFLQWFGVTRAGDPLLFFCGHSISFFRELLS